MITSVVSKYLHLILMDPIRIINKSKYADSGFTNFDFYMFCCMIDASGAAIKLIANYFDNQLISLNKSSLNPAS